MKYTATCMLCLKCKCAEEKCMHPIHAVIPVIRKLFHLYSFTNFVIFNGLKIIRLL